MDELVFNVKEAKKFSEEGEIEQWVHLFLNSVGKNKPFSEGLKLQQRYWLGPILISLDKLHRCCGPEDGIKYQQSVEHWGKSISKMQKLIQEGWDMPPLIVNHSEDYLEVNDGNHRLEALIREGVKEFWVILWDSDHPDNLRKFRKQ